MSFNPISLLITWAATAVAFFIASKVLKGMTIRGGIGTHFVIAAVFGVVLALLGWLCLTPLFHMLTLGTFLMLGLGAIINLVVMTLVIAVTDKLSKRLSIDGLGTAFWAALIVTLVLFAKTWLMQNVF